ncbi:MAG: hypothetical protein U5Q16_00040 [Gammaproteobacteria bacterium]|nr:hypothetical protein [Gammaproteobacteria bacterium]
MGARFQGQHRGDLAGVLGVDDRFHFHGTDDEDRVAGVDLVARGYAELYDMTIHRSAYGLLVFLGEQAGGC